MYSYADGSPADQIDPTGYAPKDKRMGYSDEFWRWVHRNVLPTGRQSERRNLDPEEVRDAHEEWVRQGSPPADNKGKSRPLKFDFCEANPAVCAALKAAAVAAAKFAEEAAKVFKGLPGAAQGMCPVLIPTEMLSPPPPGA